MKELKNQEPKGEELTTEQIEALKNLDAENVPNPDEPKVEDSKGEDEEKPLIPENENPMLTKALESFRALVGKPTKGCEKLINAVIHKRSFDGNGILNSKPFIQYFDKREYDNFLKHPNGFVVELEIHNPFK